MKAPRRTTDEAGRLRTLRHYGILEMPPEQALDDLTALAAQVCAAPISLISLVDDERQWFTSRIGLGLSGLPRDESFCTHALHDGDILEVEDAAADERFADNPLVVGEPGVRFYAGAPLVAPNGQAIGTLCVMDRGPRRLTAAQKEALRALSRQVMTQLELRRHMRELSDREQRLRAIFDTEPECVKLLASDGSLIDMNPAGLRMIEADSLQQVEHHCVFPLVAEPHRQAFEALTERVFRGESGTLQFEVAGLKGGRRWLETHATPLRDSTGAVSALLGITRDITDRQEAETRLRESEERFAKLFYSNPAALILARLSDRQIVDVNAAFEKLTGHTRQTALGRTILELGIISPQEREAYLATLRDRGAIRDLEFEFRNSAAELRTAYGSAELISLNGEPHMIASAIDLTARRQAEASLRESEERLRLALAAAQMGIFDWDLPNSRITWSRWHEEMWGLQPGGFPGTYDAFAERVHPGDLRALEAEVRRCMATRDHYEREFRVVWPDGSVHWVLGRGEFVYDADGTPKRMRGVVSEVTARKRAELRILKLNRVYAMLSGINETIVREHDPAVILSKACRLAVDAGGFLMAWIGLVDPSAARLDIRAHADADADTLGVIRSLIAAEPPAGCAFTADAIRTGRHAICDDIAGDVRADHWREAALARGYRSMAAFPLRIQDRTVGTFNIYASEVGVFDSEEARLLDELAVDISFALEVHEREQERHRAEAERRDAEERLRQVVENIQEVFWITNPSKTEMLYASPAYESVWGRPLAELYRAPRTWLDAIHPEDRDRIEYAAKTKQMSGHYHETYRITRPDGSIRWVHERAFPIRDAAGAVTRIVGTAIDVTDQRQLEEQFRQAQKMESIGRLAGGIAHDFNNLLTVINGFADLTIANLDEHDPLRADLEQVRLAGDRAAGLTRQLLALSRQQILTPQVIDLNAVIIDMEKMLRRLIGEDVELSLALSAHAGSVEVDPSQMEQVILNLAINARDAMPDGGTLSIVTCDVDLDASYVAEHPFARPGPHVMLAVSDTGVGMDETTRQRIFEPFFTTKEVGKGTGLGLSTVYGILKQSGASIWVYSEPGRGATFKIYLPRVAKDRQAEPPVRPVPAAHGTETILLVEDEPALRDLTKRILVSAGYTVLEAGNGGEALLLGERHCGTLQLMLTDVVMPGMNGRELAGRLSQICPNLRVLYTSGYTDDAIFRHGVLDDVDRFISKPYTPADLKRKVREVLDARAQRP